MQPKDISQPNHANDSNIILKNRQDLKIDGVEDVISYHEAEVLIQTVLGTLRILGEKMQIQDLSVTSRQCHITGQICGMIYDKTQSEQQQGFWKRLIR